MCRAHPYTAKNTLARGSLLGGVRLLLLLRAFTVGTATTLGQAVQSNDDACDNKEHRCSQQQAEANKRAAEAERLAEDAAAEVAAEAAEEAQDKGTAFSQGANRRALSEQIIGAQNLLS